MKFSPPTADGSPLRPKRRGDNDSAVGDLRDRCFERILLVKPSSLGDVVHALPVLHGLRRRFPSATIDWLIASSLASLLRGHPDVSHVLEFDRRKYGRLGVNLGATRDFLRFVGQLRAKQYDLVIDLQGLFRSGFLTWMTRAPVRVGFADAREAAWAFYNRRIPTNGGATHAVDHNYQVAKVLGFEHIPVRFHLALSQADRSEALALLAEDEPRRGNAGIVAIAPGARWETKRWIPERFAAVINALHAGAAVRCVLVGGPSEAALCEQIGQACRAAPLNLAGRTSLVHLAAVLERCDVVLCHDSGVMHLAVALERPLVCLTGPTDPRRTGPYRRLDDVLREDLPCSPCFLRRLSQCEYGHRCMQDLKAEVVVKSILARLK